MSGHPLWQYFMKLNMWNLSVVLDNIAQVILCLPGVGQFEQRSCSASSSRSWSCIVEVKGARDSVSAALKFFAGTQWMLHANRSM